MDDLKDKSDVKIFIDAFYLKVRKDKVIGPVFASKIADDQWPKHLERMYSFWNTVLFAAMDYRGNPFSKHQSLPLFSQHFDRWISLFEETLKENFTGPKSDEAMMRVNKMALMFLSKLDHIRSNPEFKNIM